MANNEINKKESKPDKQPPITVSDCLTLSLRKIKRYFRRVESNNFSTGLTFEPEISSLTDLDKAQEIYNYIRLSIKEKKKFFDTSKYNFINFEENIDKLRTRQGFDQANFSDLIEKCKLLMKMLQEKNLYIEKLEQEIIVLIDQQKRIIKNSKTTINDMKDNQLNLINKIKELNKNGKLIEEGKHAILKKTQELHERTQENINLRKEQKKMEQNFRRQNASIRINKNNEIKSLMAKLHKAESYQQGEIKERNEKFCYRNKFNEARLHMESLKSENDTLACRVAQLSADNYALGENYKKVEKLLVKAISKLQL